MTMTNDRSYRYRVVDVFTETPLEGNPLAVFPSAEDLDGETMQRIAKEFNLSETAFIFSTKLEGCAARVRIFTPAHEQPFAGHPTIGTAFVLLDEGVVPKDSERFVLEEKVGPVPIRVDKGERPMIWLRTPEIQAGPTFERAACAQALGLDPSDLLDAQPQQFSAGNPNVYIPLRNKSAVDRAWIDMSGMKILHAVDPDKPLCVFVFTPTPEGVYSRMFAPEQGVAEDSATGSATGPLAAYMIQNGLTSGSDGSTFVSEQGTKMGRRSHLFVKIHGKNGSDGIDVGGYVTPLMDGTMRFARAQRG
jgi:trans-2,3-dihydro-3-hydroxyanthranilate isomerase